MRRSRTTIAIFAVMGFSVQKLRHLQQELSPPTPERLPPVLKLRDVNEKTTPPISMENVPLDSAQLIYSLPKQKDECREWSEKRTGLPAAH